MRKFWKSNFQNFQSQNHKKNLSQLCLKTSQHSYKPFLSTGAQYFEILGLRRGHMWNSFKSLTLKIWGKWQKFQRKIKKVSSVRCTFFLAKVILFAQKIRKARNIGAPGGGGNHSQRAPPPTHQAQMSVAFWFLHIKRHPKSSLQS